MLASALGFTAMTTLIKFLGDDYSAALQTFYRQVAGFIILLPIIVRRRSAAFATTRPGILIFRSAAGTLGMILSFYAFQKMPLADANALSFTRTLWLVPLAAFLIDAGFTLLARMLKGERWMEAHTQHLYQRCVKRGYSHVVVTLNYALFSIAGTTLLVVLSRLPLMWASAGALAWAVVGACLWRVLRTRVAR